MARPKTVRFGEFQGGAYADVWSLARAKQKESKTQVTPMMRWKYDNLSLWEETDPQKLKEGHYRYLVSSNGIAHIAFRTKEGLERWLSDTGLKEGKKGWGHIRNLRGSYTKVSMAGNYKLLDKFGRKNILKPSVILDNGEYTRAYIKEGKRGNTIYYLNPNYERRTFPYFEMRKKYG